MFLAYIWDTLYIVGSTITSPKDIWQTVTADLSEKREGYKYPNSVGFRTMVKLKSNLMLVALYFVYYAVMDVY